MTSHGGLKYVYLPVRYLRYVCVQVAKRDLRRELKPNQFFEGQMIRDYLDKNATKGY